MRLVAHRVDAAGVDPSIVEIEKRTDREGIINGLVAVACFMQQGDIRRSHVDGVLIDLPDKPEQRFFPIRESGRLEISDDAVYQFPAIQ